MGDECKGFRMVKIILASHSPRRKELLAGLGIPFEVRVIQDIDEHVPEDLPASQAALYIAKSKAKLRRTEAK